MPSSAELVATKRRTNEAIAKTLIGKQIDNAEVTCEIYNLRYRTVRSTDEHMVERTDRISMVVEGQIVVRAWIG